MLLCCFFLFFFFQAEDGIRGLTVTGVQTCALPIWAPVRHAPVAGCAPVALPALVRVPRAGSGVSARQAQGLVAAPRADPALRARHAGGIGTTTLLAASTRRCAHVPIVTRALVAADRTAHPPQERVAPPASAVQDEVGTERLASPVDRRNPIAGATTDAARRARAPGRG